MSGNARIIFDSGEIKAIYQPADSDFIVFSFNGLAFSETGTRFFGDTFFANRGIAAVGLVDTKSTWYRDHRFARAIDAVAAYPPLRSGQRRLTYGASMGAYGALKYGRALEAHASLAVGPQISIDPARVGAFDQRYRRFFDPVLHRDMDVADADLAPHNFVFSDPAVAEDREQVALLPNLPAIHRVASTFIGHPGIGFFTQLRLIEALFRLAAADAPDPARFRQLIRARRRDSAEYWFNRAEYLRTHRPPFAEQIALHAHREALRLSQAPADRVETFKLTGGYADALLDAGRPAEARPLIDGLWNAWERGFLVPGLQPLLKKAQDLDRLRRLVEDRAGEAGHPEGLLNRSRLMFIAGDLEGARAAADAARALAADSVMVWRRLRWLYQRLDREADVLAADAMLASLDKRSSPDAAMPDPLPPQPAAPQRRRRGRDTGPR